MSNTTSEARQRRRRLEHIEKGLHPSRLHHIRATVMPDVDGEASGIGYELQLHTPPRVGLAMLGEIEYREKNFLVAVTTVMDLKTDPLDLDETAMEELLGRLAERYKHLIYDSAVTAMRTLASFVTMVNLSIPLGTPEPKLRIVPYPSTERE